MTLSGMHAGVLFVNGSEVRRLMVTDYADSGLVDADLPVSKKRRKLR